MLFVAKSAQAPLELSSCWSVSFWKQFVFVLWFCPFILFLLACRFGRLGLLSAREPPCGRALLRACVFLCVLCICSAPGWLCKYCTASGPHPACESCCILALCILVSSVLSLELAILMPDMSCERQDPDLPSMPTCTAICICSWYWTLRPIPLGRCCTSVLNHASQEAVTYMFLHPVLHPSR